MIRRATTWRPATDWTAWSVVTSALAVLLLALLAAIGVTTLASDDGVDALIAASPWGDEENELTARHREVAAAARAEALAFLAVDYRDMDPLMDRVLAGATGEFEEQYAESRDDLKRQAIENKSISTGEVVALGVGELDEDSALVYVAANSEVQNTATDGTRQPRYYRLQLDLVREGDRWLTSSVQFVG